MRIEKPASVCGAPMAMARPRRPRAERAQVLAIAGDSGSARCRAARAAAKVVRAFLADEGRTDPLQRAIFAVQQELTPDPAHELAVGAEGAATSAFASERLHRFEARGCRQLPDAEWHVETAEVAAEVEKRLARRFRDYCK